LHQVGDLFELNTVTLYAFFWVIPRRLNFICLPAYEDGTECSRNVGI